MTIWSIVVPKKLAAVATAFCVLATAAATTASAADPETTGSIDRGASGLPLPRFVSIKANRVNLRIGPGRNYAVSWLYVKPGLPVEIIQEYDNWRRIRDSEGTEGWVYQSLLSGKRTAIAAPWGKGDEGKAVAMHREASDDAPKLAVLEPGVLTEIASCDGEWCEVEAGRAKGYVHQSDIWGAYPGEIVSD